MNIEIPKEPQLSLELKKITKTTPVGFEIMNQLFGTLIENDAFLNLLVDTIQKKIAEQTNDFDQSVKLLQDSIKSVSDNIPTSLPANGGNADHAVNADNAYNATFATSAERANNADRLNGVTWHYAGQGGTPSWVWGSTSGTLTDQYVFSPANFSVNYANTCNRATNANWADGATNANNAGAVRGFPFAVAIQAGAPSDSNALWIPTV